MTNASNIKEPRRVADLEWEDISALIEGLAFAARPVKNATRGVTAQYDLGPRGAFILQLISVGTCLPMDLAVVLKTSRPLIAVELKRLTEAGLVVSKASKTDGRRTELSLTRKGASACQHIRSEMTRILKRNLAGYSVDEFRLAARMLRDVRRDEIGDGAPVKTRRAPR